MRSLGLRHADDDAILAWAQLNGAVVATKDEAFALLAHAQAGGPAVLWVRTGNGVNRVLLDRSERAWASLESYLLSDSQVVQLR